MIFYQFQGSRVKVISYESRPMIKITPGPSSKDRRVQSYNYIKAVKVLPTNFSSAEVAPIIRRINPKLVGQIKSTFIVLSDDDYKPWVSKSAPPSRPTAPAASRTSTTSSSTDSQGSTPAMDSNPAPDGSATPAAPATSVTPVVSQPSGSQSGRISHKRGASTDLTRSAKK